MTPQRPLFHPTIVKGFAMVAIPSHRSLTGLVCQTRKKVSLGVIFQMTPPKTVMGQTNGLLWLLSPHIKILHTSSTTLAFFVDVMMIRTTFLCCNNVYNTYIHYRPTNVLGMDNIMLCTFLSGTMFPGLDGSPILSVVGMVPGDTTTATETRRRQKTFLGERLRRPQNIEKRFDLG